MQTLTAKSLDQKSILLPQGKLMTPAQLDEMLHIIEQHGLSLVLLLLLVFWLRPKIDQLWNAMTDIKKVAASDSKKDNVEVIIQLNTEIKAILREGLIDTQAGWVQLWQFHNGTRGIGKGKIPFMFLTLTNEVCTPDLTEMRTQFKELPLSMFDFFATQLVSKDIVVHGRDMTNPDGSKTGMGKMMQTAGAECSAMRAIRDVDGAVIGFITFIYPKFTIFDDEQRQKFLVYGQRMAALLASLDDEDDTHGKSKS
jgi:hypothetical protein